MVNVLIDGDNGCPTFIFAHGAGAPMDSEFMSSMAARIASEGIKVVRFEFPYMQARRETGRRRLPDQQPKLVQYYCEVIDRLDFERPVIGGKSMGGRMATMVALERDVAGVAVLGYPFHPAGKPDKLRTEHFSHLNAPVLICQGDRDAMGSRQEVGAYRIPSNMHVEWFVDGNHDLKPRKASGHSYEAHLNLAAKAIGEFIHKVSAD